MSVIRKSLLVIVATCLLAGHAWAEKPYRKTDEGKHHKAHKEKHHDNDQREVEDDDQHYRIDLPNPHDAARQFLFNDQHRVQIRDYYYEQEHLGKCPPGLAKKRKGCMPPGQAKKWTIGQRFPSGASHNNLPPDLLYRLGQPPAGYGYVQSASDILMLNLATGVISDIIYNLGQ